MELSHRLAAIASFIPPGARVADIGSDHAMLPLYLVSTGRSPGVIASDINEKPYLIACRQVEAAAAGDRVEVRKGDGLAVLRPGEVDVIVIAGMGANTIMGILSRSPEVLAGISRLVLQPMSHPGALRRWLAQNSWRLADEEVLREDGKFYVIIVAEPGEEHWEDRFLPEVGPRLVEKCSPVLIEYLEKIKADYQRVLSGLAGSRSEEAMKKAIALTAGLKKLQEVINQCRQNVER